MCWKREEPEPSPPMPPTPAENNIIEVFNTTVVDDKLVCPEGSHECDSNGLTCFNGGISCCSRGSAFCKCPEGWESSSICHIQSIDDPFQSVSAQANSIDTKVLAIVLVIVFLVAFAIVIAIIIRKRQRRHQSENSSRTEATNLQPSNSDSANNGRERAPLQNQGINGCNDVSVC